MKEKSKKQENSLNLFIDTTNNYIIFGLFTNSIFLDFEKNDSNKSTADNAVIFLEKFLSKNKIKYESINNIFITVGPGSYTGIRIGITMAKMFSLIHGTQIFTIDSLLLQAGIESKVCSLLQATKTKYFYSFYDKSISKSEINIDELDKITKKCNSKNFKILVNYNEIDLKNNIIKLSKKFKKIKNIDNIKLTYFNSFI